MKITAFIVLLLGWCIPAIAADFPRPASLGPAVEFWVDVYTEISTDQGYVHDSENLSIVYETMDLPEQASNKHRRSLSKKAKARYARALESLGQGKRSELTETEARALAAWPEDTSSQTFAEAAHNVRFQLGQSDRFKEGLVRSGQWRTHIQTVLAEYGLPSELEVLPHVESSFNPAVYSKVAAAGMWQFMPRTARDYMRVDHVVDERMDPYIATIGAARLLKRNYGLTGTWPLALTSYNHGTGGVLRAARQLGTKDIGVIVESYRGRAFGFASRNFYASFLAALEVDQNAESYFGPIEFNTPITYDQVVMGDYVPATSFAQSAGIDLQDLKRYNPALRSMVWSGEKHIPRGYTVRMPAEQLKQPLSALLASVPASARFSYQQPDLEHRIEFGDSLSTIAQRYGTSVSKLMALNGLSNSRIRAGKKLILPGTVSQEQKAVIAVAKVPEPGMYVIRRGDSLWSIARRFNISQRQLIAWNNVSPDRYLQPGRQLRVSAAGDIDSATESGIYVIQRGDSLWSIARRFKVSEQQLVSWNGLSPKRYLQPGQKLKITSS
ncbi:MAG: LysM peptidoglycan-binding domain-containing protein [Pseudomonadota bacterium]